MYTIDFTIWYLFVLIARTNENVCFMNQILTKGRITDGDTTWASKTNDVVECVQLCVRMKKCKSFNYHYGTNFCEINSRLGTEATFEDNVVHSDIANWPSQIDPNCHPRPCAEDEICIPGNIANTQNPCSYSCMKRDDRKCPPPEGTMSSQPRTVGSTYTHRCGHGTVGGDSAICLPSGKWNKTIDTNCTSIHGMPCVKKMDCEPIKGLCTEHVCNCKPGSQYDETSATCAQVCEEGWIHLKEKCYFFGDEETSAFDARTFCKERDAQLIQIDSEEENNFLEGVMANMSTTLGYWIDLYQFGVNGQERWMTSNDTPTFTNWGPNEPDDNGTITILGNVLSERCTVFFKESNVWADQLCELLGPSPLCQRSVGKRSLKNG